MPNLLVNLYENDLDSIYSSLIIDNDIKIKRVLSPNIDDVIMFIKEQDFDTRWSSEVKGSLYKTNPNCFIATYKNKIIGFACFDATAKAYFGPTGVSKEFRGKNIGQALFIKTLIAMKEDGYGFVIIGGAGKNIIGFYSKHVSCLLLESKSTIYNRLI